MQFSFAAFPAAPPVSKKSDLTLAKLTSFFFKHTNNEHLDEIINVLKNIEYSKLSYSRIQFAHVTQIIKELFLEHYSNSDILKIVNSDNFSYFIEENLHYLNKDYLELNKKLLSSFNLKSIKKIISLVAISFELKLLVENTPVNEKLKSDFYAFHNKSLDLFYNIKDKASLIFKDFEFPEIKNLEQEAIDFFNILKNANFESISLQIFKNLELIVGTKQQLWRLIQDEEKEHLLQLNEKNSEFVRNSMIDILTTFKLTNLDSIFSKLFCDLVCLKLRGQYLSLNEDLTKEEYIKENLEFSFKLINKSNYLSDLISNNKNKIKIQELNEFIKIEHSGSDKILLIYPYSYVSCPEGYFGFSIEKELFNSGKIPELEEVVKINSNKHQTSSFRNKAQIVREIEDQFVINHFFNI